MSFFNLLMHSISIISVFKITALTRCLIFLIIYLLLISKNVSLITSIPHSNSMKCLLICTHKLCPTVFDYALVSHLHQVRVFCHLLPRHFRLYMNHENMSSPGEGGGGGAPPQTKKIVRTGLQ